MSAQTQPVALPPKLQQLLSTMPDVDKVKLMQIAHQYKMDLDDPGFLPLLLTQQGIEALDKARAGLESEAAATIERVASQVVATREAEAAKLKEYTGDLGAIVRAEAAQAQTAMQQALSAWAERSLTDALDAAIKARARGDRGRGHGCAAGGRGICSGRAPRDCGGRHGSESSRGSGQGCTGGRRQDRLGLDRDHIFHGRHARRSRYCINHSLMTRR